MRTADQMDTGLTEAKDPAAGGTGPLVAKARDRLQSVADFTNRLGLATYDPFDIKSTPIAIASYMRPSFLRTSMRKLLYGAELFFPVALRKAMGVKKKPTAGGTARLAQAHLALYRLDGDPAHLKRAKTALEWLTANPGTAAQGQGWGVPFDWQTFFGTVPANTAVSHTTQGCGNAFLDYHESTGEDWAREVAEGCAEFLTHCLGQTTRPSGAVALSYTPLDHSQVVNTNAETAAFLVRCGRPQDQDLAWKVGSFVCEAQNPDGSWFYSAPDTVEGNNPIDNYHTGMLLSGLLELAADAHCRNALCAGLEFHLDNHFLPDGCPKMRPNAVYPVDSYSAGQSILTLTWAVRSSIVDPPLRSKCELTLDRLVEYMIEHLIGKDGSTVYRRYRAATMKIGSMRWSQALLMQALAEYCAFKGAEPDATA